MVTSPGLFLPVGTLETAQGSIRAPTARFTALGASGQPRALPRGRGYWAGGYGDVVYETSNELTRTSLGLGSVSTFIDIDGGVVAQFGNGETHWGGVIRPMLTAKPHLTFYGRWGFFAHADDFERWACS
ncbi:MAG: hypothetical protein U0263_17505 [Polyangiaceae bacterium]